LCLEVHSNKANKKEVLDQLGKVVEAAPEVHPREWEPHAEKLELVRAQLNDYAEAIHHRHPIGFSVFRATSQLVGLSKERRFKVESTRVRSLEEKSIEGVWDLAARFSTAAEGVSPVHLHPLSAVRRSEMTPRLPGDVVTHAEELAAQTLEAQTAWAAAAPKLSASATATRALVSLCVSLIQQARGSPGPSLELLSTSAWDSFEGDFE
jgi:hypothetical protein